MTRKRTAAWIALVLSATSCGPITHHLLEEPGDVYAEPHGITESLRIVAAHGRIADRPHDSAIRFDLASTSDSAIRHTRTWTETSPGSVCMRPLVADRAWWFGPRSEIRPEDIEVDLFAADTPDGNHRRARVTMRGRSSARAFGRWLAPVEYPDDVTPRVDGRLDRPQWELDAMAALVQHDWATLLGRPVNESWDVRPIAWVRADAADPDATPSDPQTFDSPTDFELLVAVEPADAQTGQRDDVRFARIPAHILSGALDQLMRRDGDDIVWTNIGVWNATAVDPGDLPPLDLTLASHTVDYELVHLDRYERSLADKTWRYAALPIAAVLDFAIVTSQPLYRFARWLIGEDDLPALPDRRR